MKKQLYVNLKEIESLAQKSMSLIEESYDKPSIPQLPIKKLSTKAFINRINAVYFNGKMNDTQLKCVSLFSMSIMLMELAGKDMHYQYLSYMLATVYHETAFTMKSIEEYGKGEGRPYGEPDPRTGKVYYGRSYPQLTWYDNYAKATKELYSKNLVKGIVDFLNDPDLILEPYYGVQVTVFGMVGGWFTGKGLDDYWLDNGEYDYVNARRIINGTDKAQTIAGYAREAESAVLLAAGHDIHRETISVGDHGDDVRELQLVLGVEPDGIFGSGVTEPKLMAFQSEHDLNPDGICGPATWKKIDVVIYGIK
ncbi:hypothetical protein BTZ53_11000 [Vibrio parahaemolyticus]|nr:hypothetical protein BTZ53_11000 [Vibrio parahaemolyticus]